MTCHCFKGHLWRQAVHLHCKRGADSGGFPHGDGIAAHAVTGMGDEVAADTTSRHQQIVAICAEQCAPWNIVIGTAECDFYNTAAAIRVRCMNIRLGSLKEGEYRELTDAELEELYEMIQDSPGR